MLVSCANRVLMLRADLVPLFALEASGRRPIKLLCIELAASGCANQASVLAALALFGLSLFREHICNVAARGDQETSSSNLYVVVLKT